MAQSSKNAGTPIVRGAIAMRFWIGFNLHSEMEGRFCPENNLAVSRFSGRSMIDWVVMEFSSDDESLRLPPQRIFRLIILLIAGNKLE